MQDARCLLERLFGRILSPFEQFLRRTTAGIVLVVTTIIALGVTTVLGADAIHRFYVQPLALRCRHSRLGPAISAGIGLAWLYRAGSRK